MTNLETLNALRIRANMKPLKAWKESKAKLEAAIAKLTPATVKEQLEASVEVANGETVTLAQIARELGLNPKIVRAKARRHRDTLYGGEVSGHEDRTPWTFPASSRALIVALLTK